MNQDSSLHGLEGKQLVNAGTMEVVDHCLVVVGV